MEEILDQLDEKIKAAFAHYLESGENQVTWRLFWEGQISGLNFASDIIRKYAAQPNQALHRTPNSGAGELKH